LRVLDEPTSSSLTLSSAELVNADRLAMPGAG